MTATDILAIVQRRDPDEMASTILTLWGHQTFLTLAKPRAVRKVTETVRESWLTPAQQAWEAVMGVGSFSYGMAAKWLAPLREGYTDEQIGTRLGYYLRSHKREGKMQYVSLKRFAETIGAYAPDELAFPEDA